MHERELKDCLASGNRQYGFSGRSNIVFNEKDCWLLLFIFSFSFSFVHLHLKDDTSV